MSDTRKITGAASTIAGFTFISRILGYARDAVIAYIFGAGMSADAFFVAFRVANLLRRLVGEGALTGAFIPVFTDVLKDRSKEGARQFVSAFFTLFVIILIALTIIGIFFSDYIVLALAEGFSEDPGKFSLTVSLTRVMFPYMFFIGLMAAAMGILNTLRHFAAPALSPVLLNISIIVCAFVFGTVFDVPVYALAVGVLIGGVLQFLLMLPFLKKYGMLPFPSFKFNDPGIKRIFILMGPALVGIGVYQLNILVTTRFASALPEGSISYLYYASRLMELPLGMFGVALTQATLPSLSEHASRNDYDSFNESLSFSLRMVNFITIPATVGLIVLGLPIISVLFTRGEFAMLDARGTAYALYFFSVGIVPVALARQLVSVFYSMKDTVTPVIGAVISLAANLVLCYLLRGPLEHGGLALATSIAALANFTFLTIMLSRKVEGYSIKIMIPSAIKSSVAALIMGGAVYAASSFMEFDGLSLVLRTGAVILLVAIGAGVYFLACRVLNVSEMTFLKKLIAEKTCRNSA